MPARIQGLVARVRAHAGDACYTFSCFNRITRSRGVGFTYRRVVASRCSPVRGQSNDLMMYVYGGRREWAHLQYRCLELLGSGANGSSSHVCRAALGVPDFPPSDVSCGHARVCILTLPGTGSCVPRVRPVGVSNRCGGRTIAHDSEFLLGLSKSYADLGKGGRAFQRVDLQRQQAGPKSRPIFLSSKCPGTRQK